MMSAYKKRPASRTSAWRTLPIVLLVLSLAGPGVVSAQEIPPPIYGTGLEFTHLSNWPIAGLLDRGSYEIDLRMYPEGGLNSMVTIGLLRSVNVGFSYGAENVVGRGKINWNPNVEFSFKLRLIPETTGFPGIALGYASQGYGPYESDLERYSLKSPGMYAVASKNFMFLGEMGLHFGTNRSNEGDDKDLNFFLGVDKSVGPEFYLILEYDLALNDDGQEDLGYGNGYLNFGFKWAASPRLRLEFYFTNLLDNVRDKGQAVTIANIANTLDGAGREVRIVYVDWF
jgi:hypothetical protein